MILRHEEERDGYLSRQLEHLLRAQEEARPAAEEPGPGLELAIECSHLARDIRTIYRDHCNTGEVHLYINKWVELPFCLPQKLHKKHLPGILVEPDSIYECLTNEREADLFVPTNQHPESSLGRPVPQNRLDLTVGQNGG